MATKPSPSHAEPSSVPRPGAAAERDRVWRWWREAHFSTTQRRHAIDTWRLASQERARERAHSRRGIRHRRQWIRAWSRSHLRDALGQWCGQARGDIEARQSILDGASMWRRGRLREGLRRWRQELLLGMRQSLSVACRQWKALTATAEAMGWRLARATAALGVSQMRRCVGYWLTLARTGAARLASSAVLGRKLLVRRQGER